MVKSLIDLRPDLSFSISYTTREKRHGEADAKDYFFLDKASFESMRDAGEFLEYAEVFGNYYATGRKHVSDLLNAGRDVLLEIDWQGARQVRENLPECCSIFIMPPSVAELEHRLRRRDTDTEKVIQGRLAEATDDMAHWSEFDYVIINDDLNNAVANLQAIMTGQSTGHRTSDLAVRKKMEALLG